MSGLRRGLMNISARHNTYVQSAGVLPELLHGHHQMEGTSDRGGRLLTGAHSRAVIVAVEVHREVGDVETEVLFRRHDGKLGGTRDCRQQYDQHTQGRHVDLFWYEDVTLAWPATKDLFVLGLMGAINTVRRKFELSWS